VDRFVPLAGKNWNFLDHLGVGDAQLLLNLTVALTRIARHASQIRPAMTASAPP
jgi:hypothetical protein